MRKSILKLAVLPFALSAIPAIAATPVDLSRQPSSVVRNLMIAPQQVMGAGGVSVYELRRNIDFNQTLHVRVQQAYQGHPVWGADAVVHMPNGSRVGKNIASAMTPTTTMNGFMYKDLQADLQATPAAEQAQKALAAVLAAYQHKVGGHAEIKDEKSELIVYITPENKAVWAYRVSFYVAPRTGHYTPEKPVSIVDATSFNKIYLSWNDVKTLDDVAGGGFGGNPKLGKLVYDGLNGNLPALRMQRDAVQALCYLQNADVTVSSKAEQQGLPNTVITFPCQKTDPEHNNIYWNADQDAVNGAYSPANDALRAGEVIKQMYQDWFGMPVLMQYGKPMMLNMIVHDRDPEMTENASWDGKEMIFGDGGDMLYPLSSLGIAAHEISHGFTEQHSNLTYILQSGAMNEAFSDMAAKAAEYYNYGKNDSWDIGAEVFKEDRAIRYMDDPQKDCMFDWMKSDDYAGLFCSVKTVSQFGYGVGVDVHHGSGIYNHVFYLLSTSPNWNTKKAFQVMVQANANYWTSYSLFWTGACGVISATKDLARKDPSFDVDTVQKAFKAVGIDTGYCFFS